MENLTAIRNCKTIKYTKYLLITLLKIVYFYYKRKSKIKSLSKRI